MVMRALTVMLLSNCRCPQISLQLHQAFLCNFINMLMGLIPHGGGDSFMGVVIIIMLTG
jgi:hypothetical protein